MRKGGCQPHKFGDHLYEPFEIIEEHVARGDLGVETGKSFYDHSDSLERLFEDRNRI